MIWIAWVVGTCRWNLWFLRHNRHSALARVKKFSRKGATEPTGGHTLLIAQRNKTDPALPRSIPWRLFAKTFFNTYGKLTVSRVTKLVLVGPRGFASSNPCTIDRRVMILGSVN